MRRGMRGSITPFATPGELGWAVRGGVARREDAGGAVMAILPELRPTLVVMLGGAHWLRDRRPGAAWACAPAAAVWGPALETRCGWIAGEVRAFGFALTPAGVRALAGVPPGALLGRTVGLGPAGDDFARACASAWAEGPPDVDAVLTAVQALFGPHAGAHPPGPSAPALHPDRPIARQAADAGLSERQFRRRFTAEWGAPPKLWQRLARVDAMLGALHPAPWETDGAADPALRFADEPHLIREFRRLTGFTPRGYRAAARSSGAAALRSIPLPDAPPPPA